MGLGVIGALAALQLAGCGQDSTAGQGGQGGQGGGQGDDLTGRTFLSTAATDGGQPHELVAGTRVSLWFADDGRLVANAGCNTLSGPVDVGGGTLHLSGDLSMTEMGCDAPRHAQDGWLAEFLGSGPSWRLDGDELVITSSDAELVLLDRSVAEPDKSIEGTKWLLETIFTGEAASSVPADAPAHLTFTGGRVVGSTGCNSVDGPATINGSTIEFGPLAMTRKACPDGLAEIERAIVTVLQGRVPFTIESDQLILNPGGAQGLGLRG